jgi:hypothetical protein
MKKNERGIGEKKKKKKKGERRTEKASPQDVGNMSEC